MSYESQLKVIFS